MSKSSCSSYWKSSTPKPLEVRCPKCGKTVEMFGDEEKTECRCGNTVFKDRIPTCVEWCKAAEECLGDVIDVKKIKEEAKKRAEKEGDPQFVSKLGELFKKKQQDCEENPTK